MELSSSSADLHPASANAKKDDLLSSDSSIKQAESQQLLLPDGDIYSGTLSGGNLPLPEGSGRYIWSSSGCIYEGEWRRGMRHGHGRTTWPSGAIYQGDYSAGYMDGQGTYCYSSISYKGGWKLNCKHGLGVQTYPNGDVFQGSWVHGQMQGHGCTYTWANGSTYVGDMRNGVMSGKGIFTNGGDGDSFQGNWLDGMMHGYGVYTWQDSGYYVGTWTRGLKDGKGTFYPKCCSSRVAHIIDELRKRGLLPDADAPSSPHILASSSSGNLKASLERRWSLGIDRLIGHHEESTSETTCDFPILQREYTQGVLISEVVITNSSRIAKRRHAKDIKRPGETIIKGHRSYDLMLSLQLGIRYTVGKITPILRRQVRASDYGPKASFWMNFPKKGSRLTPSHRAEDFKWRDYCPLAFRNLREMFKIDTADYMISICGSDALRELSSPGKSGSIFFLSQDDRFMIKTLRKSEMQVLLRMLPDYYHHVQTYENTLVTKFFGLHRVKPSSGQKFRFVVMGNMFCTELRIHRRFDLKGSSLGRCTEKIEIDENTTLKDLDLNYSFYLDPTWRDTLLKQVETDSKFLRDQGIMDYSLLLGFHYRAPQKLHTRASRHKITGGAVVSELEDAVEEEEEDPQGLVLVQRCSDQNVIVGPHVRGSRLRSSSANFEEVDLLLPGTARLQIQLGVNMPARAEEQEEESSLRRVYDVVLYIGIIDILQEYSTRKKIEHAYKSIKYDSLSISVVEPRFYSDRFLQFIQAIFP